LSGRGFRELVHRLLADRRIDARLRVKTQEIASGFFVIRGHAGRS
jgi:hypothetical protein